MAKLGSHEWKTGGCLAGNAEVSNTHQAVLSYSRAMPNVPDMLEEYDFSGGIRGKYADRYAEGTNVVVIDPDVIEYFPDHDAVNEALRGLAAIIKRQQKTTPETARERAAALR